MQAKNIFLGLFTTIHRSRPRLGQSSEQAQGCPGFQPARRCSILTFQLICWLWIDTTFEEWRGPLLCWSTRKKAQLEYKVLWTFTYHHEKSVFGYKRRKSRPSAMLTEDSKALLGSTARSWHAALWHRTDKCLARGQGSLFVLSHCLTPLPVQAKKCRQGLSASCFQKLFQTEGKSIIMENSVQFSFSL